jgi:hypothetical protein
MRRETAPKAVPLVGRTLRRLPQATGYPPGRGAWKIDAWPGRPTLATNCIISLGPRPIRTCPRQAGSDGRLARRLPYRVHRERLRWPTKKGRLQISDTSRACSRPKKSRRNLIPTAGVADFQRINLRDLLSLLQAPYGLHGGYIRLQDGRHGGPDIYAQSPRVQYSTS